ncbi:SymE family type I addiction module toxin [Dyadobacter sp. MSC1_007]|jgi:hypothetical protein|uniref:SymE family type I addiction module toxin n=1 Tax=Dyadobacter sp. MSC1_007 TaxID=2909264 RepID=UPI002030808B|nr:SymE family type I addiction module toxin [Dyadobacter sp. MSC1_007]
MKKTRTFKVVYKHYVSQRNDYLSETYQQVPEIRFGGKWLEEIGFDTGENFTMTIEPGKLTITLGSELINAAPGVRDSREN